MSMITATAWVPRGYAKEFPTKYNLDEGEFSRISKLAQLELDEAKEDLDNARKNGTETADESKASDESDNDEEKAPKADDENDLDEDNDDDDDLKEYDLDHYDDDNEGDIENNGTLGEALPVVGNVKSLAYYDSNEADPYIVLPEGEDEGDDEREELQILESDNLILAARVEDEVAHLEVYVYEDEANNLYVHHDIMLPAIPLAVEWLDLPVGEGVSDKRGRGNFVAVGTMDPDIELWDLDTVDRIYPNAICGMGEDDRELGVPRKKKRKRKHKANDEYHVDAVLSLAANRKHRNLMASASADKTVKLWDLDSTKCAKSYDFHTDKVCSLAWHPSESTVLLSGSYDKTVVAADMRATDNQVPRWRIDSDVEIVKWDPHDTNYFYVTTESGAVYLHDVRQKPPSNSNETKPVWKLQAHDESVSAFDVNGMIPGLFVTGSSDKQVKLWNVSAGAGPTMVTSRNLGIGRVFSAIFAPDREVGFRLAAAGSKGSLQVWDTSTNAAVRRAFEHRLGTFPMKENVKERLVGLQDGKESDEEENDGGGVQLNDDDDRGGENGWESMEE